jgi:hypothetical protein
MKRVSIKKLTRLQAAVVVLVAIQLGVLVLFLLLQFVLLARRSYTMEIDMGSRSKRMRQSIHALAWYGYAARGVIHAESRAILEGRFHVTTDDIRAVAHPVLRHRLVTNFHADSQGVGPDDVIDRLLEKTPVALQKQAQRAAQGL